MPELRQLEHAKAEIQIPDEESISEYYEIRQQLEIQNKDLRDVLNHPTYALPFLQPGRLVRVKHEENDFGWGCVVNFQKRLGERGKPLPADVPPQQQYIVDVLLHIAAGSAPRPKKGAHDTMGTSSSFVQPCQPDQPGEYAIVPVLLSTLDGISHIRIFLPKDLKPPEARQSAFTSVHEVQKRFVTGIALLDPVENMGIVDENFKKLLRRIEMLEAKLLANPLHETPQLAALYDTYHQKQELANKVRATKKKIASAHSVMHLDELKNRKRALRRLGFATSDDVVEMKGRVACEISTGDELLLTEMIFNGAFTDLDPEQCAALLSCFVFSEKVRLLSSLSPVQTCADLNICVP